MCLCLHGYMGMSWQLSAVKVSVSLNASEEADNVPHCASSL